MDFLKGFAGVWISFASNSADFQRVGLSSERQVRLPLPYFCSVPVAACVQEWSCV
jgi:hypothetical protein